MKAICTTDHAEIIAIAWEQLPDSQKDLIIGSILEALKEHQEAGNEVGETFIQVIKASWSLGFHYCLVAVEAGALL